MSLLLLNAITATTSVPSNTNTTATITAVSGANLVDGETFTISRGGTTITFEFDSNSSYTAGRVPVVFAGGDTSTQVATAIALAITNTTWLNVTAVGSVATVTITANVPGPEGNMALAESVANGSFAVTQGTNGAYAGHALYGDQPGTSGNKWGWQKRWNQAAISVKGAGTGALTFQGVVYLYSTVVGQWLPAGISSTIANRGMLNDGTTITGTTTLVHSQPLFGLSAFERIALQATILTGTSMTVSAYLTPIVPEA